MQTQIRLPIKEQSDLDLHCIPFHLDYLGALPHLKKIHFFLGGGGGSDSIYFRCPNFKS